MTISTTLPLTLFLVLFSAQSLADRENDMWQQFKAQKGMSELDAQFAEPAPAPAAEPEVRVVERIVEVEVEVPVQAAPAPQAQPIPKLDSMSSMITVESDGYVLKMGDCKLAYRNIKCKLSIVNMEADGGLSLYANYSSYSSRLYDRNGNEYVPSNVSIGNKNNDRYITNKYVQGVTAKGTVEFKNVNVETKAIALFELSIHNAETGKYNRLQFRNVNLSL